MVKPCFMCHAYVEDEAQCGLLLRLQGIHPANREARAASIDELLFKRPCQFSIYIKRMARNFTNKRGLRSQVEPEEIHNDVVAELMEFDFRRVKRTHEDFRVYVTSMTRNAVHGRYVEIHGDYCCGTCGFYLVESKGLPSRCGNPDLKPTSGQWYIHVDYSTKPKTVEHSVGNGCSLYARKQFVDLTELNLVTVPEKTGVEETLAYMESLGPRQRHQAMLIRLTLDGYSIAEIARQTGRHRTTIPKELNGTSEKEDDGTGNKIVYHQAGAYDVFRAIYTSAIFDLKRGEPDVWKVVDRRDFSSDEVRPSFTSIVREPSITKREAIEHYIDGWDWISKGGRIMPGRKDDKDEKQPEPPQPTRLSMKASEMQHPDSHALLSFAEDTLDREARGRIAAHTLICESCSAELEHIETETLPEMERPISVMERLSWLAARLVGRVRGSRETEEKGRARVWISAWVRMEAYDLRQEADQAMLSSRGDVSCEAAHNFLLEGIALYQAGRVREALAPWTNAEFIFRLQGLEGEGALCEMYVGVALVNLGQPQLAIEHHERARAVLARLGFKEQVADCEMYIGVALVNLGQPQQAIEHYKRARAVFAGLGFKKQVADCEMGIGVALVDLGQPQQAIEHYERARAVFFPLGFERVVADCEMRIGNALSGLGRPQEAIEHYQRAKAIFTRIGFENEVADCEMRISSALSDLGHQQEATEHYQRARDIYFRLGFHKELANDEMNIGSTLSDLCQQQQAIEPHEPESEPGLRALVVQGTDETYRFLTVLDEEEAGELYLFMSIYGEHKGPVYCWEVKGAQVELPFIPDEKERRHYQAYLTDREVPVPEGVHLNPKINADERSEERRQLLAAFLGALERGEVNYRAAEQDWL